MKTGRELTGRGLELSSLEKQRFRGGPYSTFQYLKEANKNNAKVFFTRASSDMTGGKSFKLKKIDSVKMYKEDILYNEGDETLKQVSQ